MVKYKPKFILYKRYPSRDVKIIKKDKNFGRLDDTKSATEIKALMKKGYGFAEGPFHTNQKIRNRLGMMNKKIPSSLKPKLKRRK